MAANGQFIPDDSGGDVTMEDWVIDAQEELDATVKVTGAQTIAGAKTFSDAVTVDELTVDGSLSSPGMDLDASGSILSSVDTSLVTVSGGDGATTGANTFWAGGTHASIAHFWGVRTGSTTRMQWAHNGPYWNLALNNVGNVGELALGGTTFSNGTNTMVITNGTAPTASLANSCLIYTEDVSASSELKVRDEAGNVTTLSSHNQELIPTVDPADPLPFTHRSFNPYTGKGVNAYLSKALMDLEVLTGEKYLFYEDIPTADWTAEKADAAAKLDAARLKEAQNDRAMQIEDVCSQKKEIPKSEALEQVPVMRRADPKTEQPEFEVVGQGHVLDEDTGELSLKDIVQEKLIDTGKLKWQVKPDVQFTDGKFFRCHTREEAEAIVGELPVIEPKQPKQPPEWIADRLKQR